MDDISNANYSLDDSIYHGNDTHKLVEQICSTLAIIINVILLTLICMYSRPEFGKYKYLMMSFTMYEIVYAGLELLVQPGMFSYRFSLAYYPTTFIRTDPFWSMFLLSIFSAFYTGSIMLLVVHFYYRYVAICQPERLIWFDFPRVFAVVFFVLFAIFDHFIVCFIFAETDQETIKYLRHPMYDALGVSLDRVYFIGALYFRENPNGIEPRWSIYWVMGNLALLNCFSLVTMLILGRCTYSTLTNSTIRMSPKTRRLQMQLFNALTIQTLIPLCTSLIPVCISFFGPMFCMNIGTYAALIPISCSLYPMLDPLAVLFIVDSYRRGFLRLVRINVASSSFIMSQQNNSNQGHDKIPQSGTMRGIRSSISTSQTLRFGLHGDLIRSEL